MYSVGMTYHGGRVVELYGGAAKCLMPVGWIDASTLREIPDHQEVYLHPEAHFEQSVIIEILQFESNVSDADASSHFFNDLGLADGSLQSDLEHSKTTFSPVVFLSSQATRIHFEGVQLKAKVGSSSPVNPVLVYMELIRVPELGSDILVTCHSLPDGKNEIEAVHRLVVDSLEFLDKSLFV